MATGMRVRIQSETMAETFVPMRVGRLHGRATKRPVLAGGYEIAVEIDCGRHDYGCSNMINSAINLFNIDVRSAGILFMD